MKKLLILTCLINLTNALELKDLSIEFKKAIGTNRHWTIPDDEVKQGELNFIIRQESKFFYTESKIHTMFTNRQFRYGALESEVGAYYKRVEVFIHHKSEHLLDGNYGTKYPNQNSLGVRIKLD